MDPSEFPGSLGPLSLPDKPLIGDLPADMEFGEDLLASQTASVPEASVLPPQEMEWEAPKEAAPDGSLELGLVKAADLGELSQPSCEALGKPDALDLLEKPSVLEGLSKEQGGVGALGQAEDLDSLYELQGPMAPEEGPGDPSAPGAEALVPEAWKEEPGVSKMDSEAPKDVGAESLATLPDSQAAESPEVVEVGSTPLPKSQRLRLMAPRPVSGWRRKPA